MTNTPTRVVAVAGQKGGPGKTTVTMNLASLLAENSRVLVVDVDPQGSAMFWARKAGARLPFEVAHSDNPHELAQMRSLPFDTILVDTPGNLTDTEILAAVLEESDFAVLPTEAAPLSVQPLVNTVTQLVLPSGVDYKVLLNKIDSRQLGQAHDAAVMYDDAGIKRFRAYIRKSAKLESAPATGLVVSQAPNDRDHRAGVKDFTAVALELTTYWATNGTTTKEN